MMRNLFVISEKSIQKTRNLFQDSNLMTLDIDEMIIQGCCGTQPILFNLTLPTVNSCWYL